MDRTINRAVAIKTRERKIDIHNVNLIYEQTIGHFKEANISEKNKRLCLEFVKVLSVGWGESHRVSKHRLVKILYHLKEASKILESLDPKLTWSYLEKNHTKEILLKIENKDTWGEWSIHHTRQIIKQFITWLRKEYGYPGDYPDSKKLNDFLPFIKTPIEVDYKTRRPKKLKDISEIPTKEEVDSLISIWDHKTMKNCRNSFILARIRNKAFMAVLGETGIRIGGLGDLQIKNVSFDKLGARLTIFDKTMTGQPVRLVTSAIHLKDWWQEHPWRDNPEAPLWPGLQKACSKKVGDPLTYNALCQIINFSRTYYNEYAKANGLPLITRRLTPHGFRYFAQKQDVLSGMPLPMQCAQRGWTINSDRPQYYTRVSTEDIDRWFAEKYGLEAIDQEYTKLKENLLAGYSKSAKPVKKLNRLPPRAKKEPALLCAEQIKFVREL